MRYLARCARHAIADLAAHSQPGTRWAYSTGLDFLTLVVEAISGLNIEEYYQRHIFACVLA